jgi:hypothetical protein
MKDAQVSRKIIWKKLLVSLVALTLVLLGLLTVFDDIGRQYTDASFKRALLTFGVARGLNGVISVAQGTEVAMEPAGVGVIFAPGQILDPVNDLIERFSWIMLASTTSLGVQSLALKMFSSLGFSLLVAVVVVIAVGVGWRRQVARRWRQRLARLAAVMLLIRFLIPALAICSEGFYQLFLASEYDSSSAYLTQTRDTLGRLEENTTIDGLSDDELSWYEGLRRNLQSTLSAMDVEKHVAELQIAVEHLTEHTINLIVVFTVQTIVFPLMFLWLTMRVVRRLL